MSRAASIRDALRLLNATGHQRDETVSYDVRHVEKIDSLLRSTLDSNHKHALSQKHHRAVLAIGNSDEWTLPDDELRASIGNYATNVIKSLVARGLMCRDKVDAPWKLTLEGHQLYDQLKKTRAGR